MYFGAHSAAWAISIMLVTVGVSLIIHSRRSRKRIWDVPVAVLALLMAFVMFWDGWVSWPVETTHHFLSVVFHGEYDEAKEMLSEPGQLTIQEDGGITIVAADTSRVTLPPEDLPLVGMFFVDSDGIAMRSWSQIMSTSKDFQLGLLTNKDLTVHCTAERGNVRIRRVERTAVHWRVD